MATTAAAGQSLTSELAKRVSSFSLDQVPPAAIEGARLAVLDTLGATIAGSAAWCGAGRIIAELAEDQGGRPEATVVGRGFRTSATLAGLANGTLAYACDIEARHENTISHNFAVILPAALAVAERVGASGAQFLGAVIVGSEVGTRAALALDPRLLYARGFHPTSVGGVFGATAAAAGLLGLDPDRVENALGLAADQAGGLLAWASDVTEHSRPLNCGLAARDGVTAALLAARGFGGPRGVFDPDTKYNVYRAFVDGGAPELLLNEWGHPWSTEEVAYKRYACCGFIHPGLDGLFKIVGEQHLAAEQIERIVLRFPASGASVIDNNPVRSHCAQYILASAVVRGRVAIPDILGDDPPPPAATALRERVEVAHDQELDRTYPARRASIVEISTRDGQLFRERVDHARGDPENPMTEAEIRAKFGDLAAEVFPAERCAAIESAVDRVEQLASIRELSGLLAG
jgi:2-methylcitrate dehydratase PrpD